MFSIKNTVCIVCIPSILVPYSLLTHPKLFFQSLPNIWCLVSFWSLTYQFLLYTVFLSASKQIISA